MDLHDLRNKGCDELDAMFQAADPPSLEELDGDYDGLLLAGNFPPAPKHFPIAIVNQPWLPWKGKVFYPSVGGRGKGANRFAAGRFRREIWPFETRVGSSHLDDGDSLLIDYDVPGNPFWLKRGTFDELRKLGEGLYLGKGGVLVLGHKRFVFMWALQPAL